MLGHFYWSNNVNVMKKAAGGKCYKDIQGQQLHKENKQMCTITSGFIKGKNLNTCLVIAYS